MNGIIQWIIQYESYNNFRLVEFYQRQASTAIFLVPALNILAPNSGTNIYKIAADDLTNKVMLRGRVIQ